MSTLELLMQGFAVACTPANLLFCALGGIMGIVVGALPGLGSVAGTALLLPLTFKMNPTSAIITLAALYYGNMFGGAISAILINIPGDAPAVMTALDGYPMARKGKAGKALFIAFVSSAIGGLIGAVLLTFLGKAMATVGLAFGPPEIAMLIMVAMCSIGWVLGDSPVKGMIGTAFGLLISCIGIDSMVGESRMTFGIFKLIAGIPFIPTIIGFFGFSQVIRTVMEGIHRKQEVQIDKITYRSILPSKQEWRRMLPAQGRGSVLGFFIGMLPGSGATTAAFLSYISEKNINKNREEMGSGAPEGIAVAEASNNAASIGAFAPLLSLGIPGSGTAAVLMGGLMMWGLQPGPTFMQSNPEFAWGLIASMFTGDILICIICILAIPVLVNLLRVPNTILVPVIITVSIMGAYCVSNSLFDVYIMLIAGVLGYLLLYFEISLAPIALALILGPSLETALRQSLLISGGTPAIFVTRPLSLGLMGVGLIFILTPTVMGIVRKKKQRGADAKPAATK